MSYCNNHKSYNHDCISCERSKRVELEEELAALSALSLPLPPNWDREIVMNMDGYRTWWPTADNGSYAAHHLRRIASELDAINKGWDDQLKLEHAEEVKDD